MVSLFTSLFGWLPPDLQVICIGVVALFFLVTILRVFKFILDIIPFI